MDKKIVLGNPWVNSESFISKKIERLKDVKIKVDNDILFEELKKLDTVPQVQVFDPYKAFIPFFGVKPGDNWLDDGELHINVKKRNIKFNFNN